MLNNRYSYAFGYLRSLEEFIEAARAVNCGACRVDECDERLATASTTLRTTAILEAGRRSLDQRKTVRILYDAEANWRYCCDPIGFDT